mmetsp:Transcript_3466/g.12594  ORF Transcript_3466/g.12594 Transcript_3466/m.12594 type:complete len:280 (-) Transcript_3466:1799-2638(-)
MTRLCVARPAWRVAVRRPRTRPAVTLPLWHRCIRRVAGPRRRRSRAQRKRSAGRGCWRACGRRLRCAWCRRTTCAERCCALRQRLPRGCHRDDSRAGRSSCHGVPTGASRARRRDYTALTCHVASRHDCCDPQWRRGVPARQARAAGEPGAAADGWPWPGASQGQLKVPCLARPRGTQATRARRIRALLDVVQSFAAGGPVWGAEPDSQGHGKWPANGLTTRLRGGEPAVADGAPQVPKAARRHLPPRESSNTGGIETLDAAAGDRATETRAAAVQLWS